MSKRFVFLMVFLFLMFPVISNAMVTVNIDPNNERVIDKLKKVNIVVKLTSDILIDMSQILIEWNGQDITETFLESAASQFNESNTEITFYYPISAADLQPGQHTIAATAGNGIWYDCTLTILDIDDQSLYVSYSSPLLSAILTDSSQLKKAVAQATKDTTKPLVKSMSASPSTVYLAQEVAISYIVTDNVALKQVELWVMEPGSVWKNLSGKVNSASGTSSSGSFKHTPSKTGTTKYGIHVVDQAGNWNSEGSAGPKSVTVTAPAYHKPLDPEFTKVSLDLCENNPDHGNHRGVDVKATNGKSVYSIAKGTVVKNNKANSICDSPYVDSKRKPCSKIDNKTCFANSCYNADHWDAALIIKHDRSGNTGKPVYTYYAHITSELKLGDSVDPDGKPIGTVNLGHLHLSVNSNNVSSWGYKPNSKDKPESCVDIKTGGWERFQDVFSMPEYKK